MPPPDESASLKTQVAPEFYLSSPNDRRQDMDAKQKQIARLLDQLECDGLLVMDPIHFMWLTSGGQARGVIDANALPALFFTQEARWLLCANVDSQRLFDEEIDGLGFQLKEWPWYAGREQLFADLIQGRKVACDRPLQQCKHVTAQLKQLRRRLTDYEQACYRALGDVLGHALEATCRGINNGDTEREAAGHLSHRLIHRGAQPISLSAVADGQTVAYRQAGYTPRQIQSYCVLTAAARKYGFCAQASRTVSFGEPAALLRKSHDAASRISATYVASSWPDAMPRQILATGQRVYTFTGAEHEWLLAPQGHFTGRALVEMPILPNTIELLRANWVVTWRASVGPAFSCDTFLITEDGPRTMTMTDQWPQKLIRVQGADFVRPDILIR